MAYSQQVYHIAKERLAERRRQALRTADFNREQLFNEIPRLREINSELLSIGSAIAKSVVKAGPSSAEEELKRLGERSLALQKEQDALLESRGINKAVFEPRYFCEKCSDTGYIEHGDRTEVCGCFLKLMADIAAEQLSDGLPLDQCTFENFRLDYYSDRPDSSGRVPYTRMSRIYDYCLHYADTFGPGTRSLLMKGGTGLGKTHLSLAIANEVIRKGMSVVYVTAPDILNKLEREHFTYQYSEQEDTFNSLLRCDLLIVDDLGTEFVSQFTISCVYNLFNSRLMAGKPMIISTNMTLEELITTYSQRFVSRLIGSCDRLDFIGEDIRTKK